MVDKRELVGCLVSLFPLFWLVGILWTNQRLRKFIEESILTTMVMDSEELRNHVCRS